MELNRYNDVDDLASLDDLDDDVILQVLQERFRQDKIYTYIGDILVAVNPCRQLNIYGKEYHQRYSGLCVRKNERPHVFWIADVAYRNLLDTRLRQCLVVNGDSGAGKTETTKYALNHLIHISPCKIPDLVEKISRVNPLIELFGNASTIFNTNSSRFGKLIELSYLPNGTLQGAKLQTFVFEKSRVVHHGIGEKNFHIFHALFAGMDDEKLLYYHIENPDDYRILQEDNALPHNSSGIFRTAEESQEFSNKFSDGMKVLEQIGFTKEDLLQVIQVLAAILHIGNIEFIEDEEVPEAYTIADERHVHRATENLQIDDREQFVNALISVPKYIRGERLETFKTLRQAVDGRDALAKELYKCLFDGVIDRINHSLRTPGKLSTDGSKMTIGILDISGFENLKSNSFEQLLINITNERLHQFFQQQIFEKEQQDYHIEGMQATDVDFRDNSDTLDLLFRSPGIISVLEEEIAVPGSTDKTLVIKYNTIKPIKESPAYLKCKSEMMFGIKHYAGKVRYNAEGFLEKNKGTLSDNLRECFVNSKNEFVRYLCDGTSPNDSLSHLISRKASLKGESISKKNARQIKSRMNNNNGGQEDSPGKGNKMYDSVTTQFKKSLRSLNEKLSNAKPLFIRCIKPNVDLIMGQFTEKMVQNQLLSCGVLEVAKIRKEGFSVRLKIDFFLNKYMDFWENLQGDEKTKARIILQESNVTHYKIGKTKIFLKPDGLDQIEMRVNEVKQRRHEAAERQKMLRQHPPGASHRRTSSEGSDISESVSIDYDSGSSIPPKDRKNTPPPSYPCSEFESASRVVNMSKDKQEEPEPLPAWDIFRITERDTEDDSTLEKRCLQFGRLVMYLLLFCFVLGLGVCSLFGITSISSGLQWDRDKNNRHLTELLLIYSIPLAVTFLVSLGKILFGRKEHFLFKYFLAVLVLESMQACGTALLLFKFLPFYNTAISLVFLMAPMQMPSIFNVHRGCSRLKGRKFTQRISIMALSFLVCLIQIGFPVVLSVTDTFSAVDSDSGSTYLVIIALALISCGWCDIFFGNNVDFRFVKLTFQSWRKEIGKSRDKINLLMCPIKCALFFGVMCRVYPDVSLGLPASSRTIYKITIRNNITQRISEVVYDSFFEDYSTLLAQIISSIMCTYFCGLACKIRMQRAAFALPLLLVTPTSLGLTLWGCMNDEGQAISILGGRLVCPTITFNNLAVPFGIAFALLLSLAAATWHIWLPSSERMAKTENLFVYPIHDGIFTGLSMLLRRRDDNFENYINKVEKKKLKAKFQKKKRPFINICATMWHESRQEMLQLLKSLFRLDKYRSQNKLAEKTFGVERDYFDLAIHVIFDDAFETEENTKQKVPNEYVERLNQCIDEAAMSVAKGRIYWERNPKKYTTPYGGRLEWTMPGGTKMIFHLKDKSKTRHRKRWSQILYLYYLLGYEMMGTGKENDVLRTKQKERRQVKQFTSLLNQVPREKLEQAYNTFILTLDGDVDFRPEAVKLLIDRMTKNDKVAAVCGRIHPIGTGPMVWYQQFEYAVGHWLQKATEHVFGCVLCCPGCFSLFRFAALMDDNVVKMYTTAPTEARHYIQFEQGEDRWLCTLLLQQGWKIDYCAGADSFTYAPESFKEFFIQRRRWAPSTMANIMDLLASWQSTVKVNDNISTPFILYQLVLMTSSLLGPGTVTLMIAGSYSAVFGINLYYSFLISVLPVIFFIAICLKTKNDTQIQVAGLLSTIYSIVMVIVTVGTVLSVLEQSFLNPNVVFLAGLGVIFSLAGLWHPKEIGCLVHGILYYLTVPSSFVFLTVYFLCNVNVVSWGTREAPKKLTEQEELEKQKELEKKAKKKREGNKICRSLGLTSIFQDLMSMLKQGIGNSEKKTTPTDEEKNNKSNVIEQMLQRQISTGRPLPIPQQPTEIGGKPEEIDIDPDYWGSVEYLGTEHTEPIADKEKKFWVDIIAKYLHPIKEDKEKQEQIKNELLELRNNVVFGYFLLNLLFTIAIFQLQVNEDKLQSFFILGEYEPLSLAFMAVFATVLVLQFVGMFFHRWGTFLHLISSTSINMCIKEMGDDSYSEEAFREAGRLQNADDDHSLLETLDSDTTGSLGKNTLHMPYEEDAPDYDDEAPVNSGGHNLQQISEEQENVAPDYDGFDDVFPHPPQDPENAYERNFSRRLDTVRRHFRQRYRRNSQLFGDPFQNQRNRRRTSVSKRQELYHRSIGRSHGLQLRDIV